MRVFLLSFFLFLLHVGARAQTLKGHVVEAATGKPLFFVTVMNLSTRQGTSTDENGRYAIAAAKDDAISFSYVGFTPVQRLAVPGMNLDIALLPLSIDLKDFTLHKEYTPYQKDSIELATLYSKELNTQRIKPKVGLNNGLQVDGLIGSAVQKMSKSYKRNKRFKETFLKDEQQKYIDTKYTPALVTVITSLTGDTLITFMNSYPMEYDFARTATELELKMWIRDNYKNYLRNQGNKR